MFIVTTTINSNNKDEKWQKKIKIVIKLVLITY